MRSDGTPGWLVFLGSTVIAAIFAAGLVLLLAEGRTVPDQLWVLLGVIATAYFGGGPFLGVMGHQAAASSALLDTVNHAIATLHAVNSPPGTPTTSPGSPGATAGASG